MNRNVTVFRQFFQRDEKHSTFFIGPLKRNGCSWDESLFWSEGQTGNRPIECRLTVNRNRKRMAFSSIFFCRVFTPVLPTVQGGLLTLSPEHIRPMSVENGGVFKACHPFGSSVVPNAGMPRLCQPFARPLSPNETAFSLFPSPASFFTCHS